MVEPTDEQLLSGFLRGEREMAEHLVHRYERPLYAFICRLSGPEEAADLFQETFLRAFAHAGSFRGASSFKTWLYTIAANQCRSRLRRAREARQPAPLPDEPADGHSPPQAAESKEIGERIAQAVAGLPGEQREVLVLKVYQELSYPEIAASLGRPLGTVKSQMRYALQHLRRTLAGLLEEADRKRGGI